MPRLPRITAEDLLRALRKVGWYEVRQRASHLRLHHPTQPRLITVPVHQGEIVKPGTLAGILEQAGISVEELRRLL